MFWNVITCQKRKISGGKKAQNDNTAPVSDTALRSKLAQGPFFFFISGEAKRSDDAGKRHNHRAQALVFRGLGAEPTNKLCAIRPGLHCLLQYTRPVNGVSKALYAGSCLSYNGEDSRTDDALHEMKTLERANCQPPPHCSVRLMQVEAGASQTFE